jgi:hypothetical protein
MDDMIGLEGALYKRWKLKGAFKRDRTRSGTRAEKHTQKEIGLENALPER